MKAAAALLGAAALLPQQRPSPPPRFKDAVTVERLVVDVRVVDAAGQPVLGLRSEDFKVKLDGKPIALESALWVGAATEEVEDPGVVVTPEGVPNPPSLPRSRGEFPEPRLVVFLLQKDMEPSRIVGLLRMAAKAEGLLASLGPDDRVAALLFDSQLHPLFDFTSDRARVRLALREAVLHSQRAVQESDDPSLLAQLDRFAMKRAASAERALQLIGEALQPLPGPKTLVFFGWGLGRFSREGVSMTADYEPARHALQKARCSVFALDVTDADYHSLEVGLIQVAEDTGGFYAKTHLFPDAALKRMERALSGYYVLSFERPENKPGLRRLEVDLVKGKKGRVLAPSAVG
jgi:VWFA-related protein